MIGIRRGKKWVMDEAVLCSLVLIVSGNRRSNASGWRRGRETVKSSISYLYSADYRNSAMGEGCLLSYHDFIFPSRICEAVEISGINGIDYFHTSPQGRRPERSRCPVLRSPMA